MKIALGFKPGNRVSIGGISYVALIPHRILEVDLYKDLFLVEYPENGMKKEWVSIEDLEERGVINLIKEAEEKVSLERS